jgi:hypothetical protein
MATKYWIGKRPSDGRAWEILAGCVEVYRLYVRRWNEIELDRNRSLEEHLGEIDGAGFVNGGARMVILHAQRGDAHWILEMMLARGFDLFGEGFSFEMPERRGRPRCCLLSDLLCAKLGPRAVARARRSRRNLSA